MSIVFVYLDRIQANPWQTRLGQPDPAYIQELALDIAANTLLQYPVGRMVDSNGLVLDWAEEEQLHACLDHAGVTVQLAFGHNRLAAFHWLSDVGAASNIPGDYAKLPIEIRSLTDEQMADFAWSENEQRRGVNPYERAIAIEKRMKDFHWTQEQAAEHLRMSRSAVTNILRLLKLPQGVQDDLRQGHIAERAALSLLPLYELPQEIVDIAERNWGDTTKPSRIIADARSGQSSELVRERIEKIVTAFGVNLQFAEWKLDEKVEHNNVHALECRRCQLRLKERNLCLDKDCYNLKQSVWRQNYLYLAQHAFEARHDRWIPLAEDDVDHSATRLEYETDAVANTIKVSGCENLRIIYREFLGKETHAASLADVGYPRAFIVCRRRNGQCTCKNGVDHLRKTGQVVQVSPQLPMASTTTSGDTKADKPEPANLQPATSAPVALSATDLQEIARQARKDKAMYRSLAEQATRGAIKIIAEQLLAGDYYAWVLLAKHLCGWSLKDDDIPASISEVAQLVSDAIVASSTGYWDDREKPAKINTWLASKYLPEVQPPTLMDIFDNEETE